MDYCFTHTKGYGYFRYKTFERVYIGKKFEDSWLDDKLLPF